MRARCLAIVVPLLAEGGSGRVAIGMANYWAARGVRVQLLTFEDARVVPMETIDPRVNFHALDLSRRSSGPVSSLRNNVERSRRIRSAVLGSGAEVVVSLLDTGNVRVLAALLGSGVPVVVSERVHPAYWDIGPVWRLLRRLLYPFAASLVVQTAQIADYVRRYRVPQVRVVPNVVRALPVSGEAPRLPQPLLLTVGRLHEQKGLLALLEAFAAVDVAGWHCALAGQGPLEDRLRRRAEELGIGGRVHLLGHQSDIGGLLAQAELFVLNSSFEGFPNALGEALAAGVCCLATRCPGGPEALVEDGRNGRLVAPEDAAALRATLRELMVDGDQRRRLAAAGCGVRERFAEDRIMAAWEAVVDEVLPGARNSGAAG